MLKPKKSTKLESTQIDPVRISTATTTESSTVFEIQKRAMLQALYAQPKLSEKFVASLLVRNIDLEENICDQLFNHNEAVLFGLYGIRPFPSPVPIRNLTPAPLAGRANEHLFVASCAVLHST